VTYGITLISRFQLWTQPIWIVLHILPFVAIAWANPHSFTEWRKFAGEHGDASGHLDLLLFGTAASVVFSLVAQIGEQVDFLRFLPRDRRTSRTSWWIALLSAGPGWIIFGALKLLSGSFLAYFALSHGVSSEHAAEPAHMYLEAFRYVLSQPDLALALTGTFVILSQIKINVTNAYAGSIAWSNFFSRLTHSHPGRVVWLVFNVDGGAAADGNRRLQGAGADAGALLQRRDCLGRRAGRRSRHQQAARPAPAAHRVQARASLRHQPGRRRRR
jgi:purine-cytosine permease-like protein